MYNRLLKLYSEQKISKVNIEKAVVLKWITQEECDQILNLK